MITLVLKVRGIGSHSIVAFLGGTLVHASIAIGTGDEVFVIITII